VLGPLTTGEKKRAIAEFHRNILERMGEPVPERDLVPDPLELERLNEVTPSRFAGKCTREFDAAEVAQLQEMVLQERPELIAHYVADMERWAAQGRPKLDRSRSMFAAEAIINLILAKRPDLSNMEAASAMSHIFVKLNEPYFN
jgi:hypothetical protein